MNFNFSPTPSLRSHVKSRRTRLVEDAIIDRLLLPSVSTNVESHVVNSYGVALNRWVGGKRQLLSIYDTFWPADVGSRTFIDPTMGSNAVFFHLAPRLQAGRSSAILADVNPALVNATLIVKYAFDELAAKLEGLVERFNRACYRDQESGAFDRVASKAADSEILEARQVFEAIRDIQRGRADDFGVFEESAYGAVKMERTGPVDEKAVADAAIFFMLQWACFNGLWRVNKSGQHNSPFDSTKKGINLHESESGKDGRLVDLKVCSRALNSLPTDIRLVDDFSQLTATIEGLWKAEKSIVRPASGRKGLFVFADPPYVPVKGAGAESEGSGKKGAASFTSYAKDDFTVDDNERLAQWFRHLDWTINGPPGAAGLVFKKNVGKAPLLFMTSNASVDAVRRFYEGYAIGVVQARRSVNRDASGRGKVEELVIRNYS